MRTLRDGTQCQLSGRNFSEIPQLEDSARTLREGTQWEPPGRDSVRILREGTQ